MPPPRKQDIVDWVEKAHKALSSDKEMFAKSFEVCSIITNDPKKVRSGEFKNEKCDEVIIDGYWRGNFSLKKIFWKSDEYFSPMNDVIGFYYYKTFTKFTGSNCLYELLLI